MERLRIGHVARPHGVRGEIRVQLDDPDSTALLQVERVWIGDREYPIAHARSTTGAVLLLVEGIADRDQVAPLRGQAVEVLRTDVPLAEGEFFVADLIGCEIVDQSGRLLGRGVSLLRGAQDLLVIHDEAAGVERILPVVPEFVLSVDREARRAVVAPPEELPEEPLDR
jgi:16S rRNA processing protein RimM